MRFEPILKLEKVLFESFFTPFRFVSWFKSSFYEAVLKSVKKSFKNQIFRISG